MSDGIEDIKQKTLQEIRWYLDNCCGVYRSNGNYRKKKMYFMVPPVPQELCDDRDFATEAVTINGAVLGELSPRLQADRELILIAAGHCDYGDIKVPEEYYGDREFMLKLTAVQGLYLQHYKTFDRQMIFTAVRQNYEAARCICRYGNDSMSDEEFVKELLSVNGRALHYLGARFRDDEQIVLLALNSYRAFEYASPRLRNSDEFLRKALEVNPSCIAYAPLSYRSNRDIMTKLIDRHPYVYRYIKGDLIYDVKLALYAFSKDTSVLRFVDYRLRRSGDFKDGAIKFARSLPQGEERDKLIADIEQY